MIEIIKKIYIHFISLFILLFLVSNATVDPRNWWSLYNVNIIDNTTFSTSFSLEKIIILALFTLIFVVIINLSQVKNPIKSFLSKFIHQFKVNN